MPNLIMPIGHHATKIKYFCRMCEILFEDISSKSDVCDLSSLCMSRPLSSFYLINEVNTSSRKLDLKVQTRLKDFLVNWHKMKLFAV